MPPATTKENPDQVLAGPAIAVAKLPDAAQLAKSGPLCSLASNLPHGLTIAHKGYKLTINGANQKRAIDTDTGFRGRWGITHDVNEEWYDSWVKEQNHPAVRNGLIIKNTREKIADNAEAIADAVATGAEQVDPESAEFKAENGGIETKEDD